MANTELINKPWLDILPPPAPMGDGPALWLSIIILSLLIIAGIFYRWYKQPEQQALHQLKRMQKTLGNSVTSNKHALYKINRLLCLGLQQNNLGQFIPPKQHLTDWQVFYQQLTQLQYSKATPQIEITQQLLIKAQAWLKCLKP